MERCEVCGKAAFYQDRIRGRYFCAEDARLVVVGRVEQASGERPLIRPAVEADRPAVLALADYFWRETEVEAFSQTYDLSELPALVAMDGDSIIGSASYVLERETIHLVAMQVMPVAQGRGVGRGLVTAVSSVGREAGARQMVLVTTNDNLPALALYQQMGFVIDEVLPGAVLAHHGGQVEFGFSGIPVRDEVRMVREPL